MAFSAILIPTVAELISAVVMVLAEFHNHQIALGNSCKQIRKSGICTDLHAITDQYRFIRKKQHQNTVEKQYRNVKSDVSYSQSRSAIQKISSSGNSAAEKGGAEKGDRLVSVTVLPFRMKTMLLRDLKPLLLFTMCSILFVFSSQ